VNTCLCIDSDKSQVSTLEDALAQLLCDAQRCDKRSAVVAGCERFEALSDAAYDVIAWGFDFYRYPLPVSRQCDAVD
jgi:hypothetical protein